MQILYKKNSIFTPLPQREDTLPEGVLPLSDSSKYDNWELPGGPLESFLLTGEAAEFFTREIMSHLRPEAHLNVDPFHAKAAALLHDVGRVLTHTYYSNEVLGSAALKKMGIREDIRNILPEETIMLTTPVSQEAMDRAIRSLDPAAVIVRMADEFGKRYPGSRRLYTPEDYDTWDRNAWAANYLSRPPSGSASEAFMRSEAPTIVKGQEIGGRVIKTQMDLHVANVPLYFAALDSWVNSVSAKPLSYILSDFGRKYEPLPALAK